jgi:hypothetical protein
VNSQSNLLDRLKADTLDGCAAANEIVALGRAHVEKAIKAASRDRRASKDVSVSRSQINLSGALSKAVGEETAARLAKEHLGDDRHQHVAMFADKAGATKFMTALAAELPEPEAEAKPARKVTRKSTPKPKPAEVAKLRRGGATWQGVRDHFDKKWGSGKWTEALREAGYGPDGLKLDGSGPRTSKARVAPRNRTTA